MASWQCELQSPPTGERAIETWLQHAVARILFEDVRAYATERIERSLSVEARAAAQKGIDDAMYGLMMVLDGVSGGLSNDNQRVELAVQARLVNLRSERVEVELDLKDGDGMCIGYQGWLEGDYGTHSVVAGASERDIG